MNGGLGFVPDCGLTIWGLGTVGVGIVMNSIADQKKILSPITCTKMDHSRIQIRIV